MFYASQVMQVSGLEQRMKLGQTENVVCKITPQAYFQGDCVEDAWF